MLKGFGVHLLQPLICAQLVVVLVKGPDVALGALRRGDGVGADLGKGGAGEGEGVGATDLGSAGSGGGGGAGRLLLRCAGHLAGHRAGLAMVQSEGVGFNGSNLGRWVFTDWTSDTGHLTLDIGSCKGCKGQGPKFWVQSLGSWV